MEPNPHRRLNVVVLEHRDFVLFIPELPLLLVVVVVVVVLLVVLIQ